jgi:two-component system, OmpR family, phosphate regulon sensor histidine kinase PhoR
MKNLPIRILIGFALIASVGIFLVQGYWFREAYKAQKAEFDFQVFSSLREIALEMADFSGIMLPSQNPVEQISNNYFVVMINDAIDPSMLEALLLQKFESIGIEADFQYGIYDCLSDQMVYSNRLNAFDKAPKNPGDIKEPNFENDNYYFSVYFPGIESVLVGSMGIWIFSSLILLFVIIFFAWSALIILKQRRLSEIHTDFVNNLTHEMKTPLSSMSLALERLKSEQHPDTKAMMIMKEELENLKGNINHILDSVRSDSVLEIKEKERIDLDLLISELVKPFIDSKKFDIRVISKGPLFIQGHRESIRSILNNLLDNAIIHGKEPIEIKAFEEKENIFFKVIDAGPGIEKKHRKKIFGKFYRIPSGNIYKGKGFGLGLFLVASILRKQGARIDLECPGEGGTIFTVRFKKSK